MKMSRSIKDYREAMDSIKISDSFYKRTETLLTEIPEIKLERRSRITAKNITAVLTAAAACLAAVFGVKFAMDRHRESSAITTEITSEVTVTTEITVTASASPVVDNIGEDNAGVENDSDDLILGEERDAGLEEAGAVAAPTAETSQTAQTAQTVQTTASKAVTTTTAASEKTTAASEKQTEAVSAQPAGGAEAAAENSAETTVPLLSDVAYEYVTVEITPYFTMGNIKSGENPVKKKGTDCADIIGFIADIAANSTQIDNYSFVSVFSLRIADENMGIDFYDIYVTDLSAVVITRHDASGQVRATYGVNASDYDALRHMLFLQFGAEEDYELFCSLISGK